MKYMLCPHVSSAAPYEIENVVHPPHEKSVKTVSSVICTLLIPLCGLDFAHARQFKQV